MATPVPMPKPNHLKPNNVKVIDSDSIDYSASTTIKRKPDDIKYNRCIIKVWQEINTIQGPLIYKLENEIMDMHSVNINIIYPTNNSELKITNLENNYISLYITDKNIKLEEKQKVSLAKRYKEDNGKLYLLYIIYVGYY